jgi:uncharacterized protein YdeI (YjbR/CyaY-like superfamily)
MTASSLQDSSGLGDESEVISGSTAMGERARVQPKSRRAWRAWLEKNHASSTGAWLVYAKKHSGIPSLTYNDAVEEALCFGWIDSKINPVDDTFWARVERLLAAGLMTPAGLAMVKAAKNSGTWNARKHAEQLIIPPDLEEAIRTNPDASRNWVAYSPSRRKGVLYRLAGAKRPDTRARYLQDIIDNMARNLSHAERMERAGFRPKPKSSRRAKR